MSVNMSVYECVPENMSAHVGVWHATLSQGFWACSLGLDPP